MERHHRRGVGSRCFGLFFRLGLFLGLGMMISLFVVTAAEAVEELQARHPQRTYSSSGGDVGEAMHRNLDVQLPEDEVQGVSGQQTSEARMVYKRLVPLPLSGRRASANLVPISSPSSNHFGSSFALRRIPQLEYRGDDFGLGGQGGASDGQQAGFGRDFGGGQSGSSSSAASFRNNPRDLEGDSDFNLDDFSSFDLQNEDPQDGRHKRQHSEGGGGGDEDYFFSGFGDLQEYGESDGQHGSGRDYDYFEDHDYQGGGDAGHTGGHAGGRGGSGSGGGGGGGGHHEGGGDPSFNGDDFTHFEREFRGGITPTDYYEDYPANPESTFEGSFHEGPQHGGGGGGGGGGHNGGGFSGKDRPHSNLSPTEFVENSGGFDFGSYGPSSPSALGKGSPSSSSASELPLQKYYEPPRYEPKPSLSSSSYLYK